MSKRVDQQAGYAIGVACLFLTALCWGFVASTVKRLTADVDPYSISFFRVSMATAVFVLIFVAYKGNWQRIRWSLPWVFVGAAGRAGNYLLYNAGLVKLPSNAAAILAPVQTISMILLARWIIGERVRHKWPGLALSMAGLGLIWWSGQSWRVLADPRNLWGNTLLVLAGIASALQFCSQKMLAPHLSNLEILIPVFGWSTLITLPFACTVGELGRPYTTTVWLLLLFLGLVLTGASFLFLAEGYKRCAATTGVVITNSTIFMTLLWSRYLMHERVSAIMVVGSVLGMAGTVAVIVADRRLISQQEALLRWADCTPDTEESQR